METKKYFTIDRKTKGWPSGPWDKEPDKVQWPDKATGLPCLAVRNHHGNWCGYVGLPPGHPLHGKDYNELDHININVHGGLTFADKCSPGATEGQGICHVPGPGEPEHVWWLGFDCAHYMDCSPQDALFSRQLGNPGKLGIYRTLRYVKNQCRRLAKQLTA